jgi:AcrR family transcriptional regulator
MLVSVSRPVDHLISFTFRFHNRIQATPTSIDFTLRSVKITSMKRSVLPAARKGRPPSEMAASHAAIMHAVYALLQKKSVRDLTMEEVARRAKVGKPTLYKWWPTKATLVLAMLCERMAPNLEKPMVLTAEESLRLRVRRLIDAFNGPFGKIVAGLIAEGQSEPAILQEFFDRWVSPRRTATIADLQRGKNAGELRSETEPELLNDTIFGAIYYRFLLRSGPLTRRFGEELVEQALRGQREKLRGSP